MATAPYTGPRPCRLCGQPILRVQDDAGRPLALDTGPATWVVIGQSKDGTPQVRRSGGYVEHGATCKGMREKETPGA